MVCVAFVMAGLGAHYLLARRYEEYGRICVKVGVVTAAIASLWILLLSTHFLFIANTAGYAFSL